MPDRLHVLTILRFFAALWVALFHLRLRVPYPGTGTPVDVFLANGAHAMAFFFVLSGALLTYGYHDLRLEKFSLLRFYEARFLRIYPAYLVLHLLALPWFPSGDPTHWLYVNGLSAFGLQAWFPHTIDYAANGGTWSISVEFFFYALFPVLLPFLAWVRHHAGTARLLFGLFVLVAVPGLADHIFGRVATMVYYTLPVHRLPEFLLGIAVGLALRDPGPRSSLCWPAFAGGLLGVLFFGAIPVPGLWTRANILIVPAIALLIHGAGCLEQRYPPGFTSRGARVLIYLGQSSYCLFLFHLLPCLFLDSPAGKDWVDSWLAQRSAGALCLAYTGFSLAGGILLHEWVEKPARHYLRQRWSARPFGLGPPAVVTRQP